VPLRDALIDRLTQPPGPAEPQLDEETQRILLEMLDAVTVASPLRARGDEAVVAYLNDLSPTPKQ
jgi:hypothetical protein